VKKSRSASAKPVLAAAAVPAMAAGLVKVLAQEKVPAPAPLLPAAGLVLKSRWCLRLLRRLLRHPLLLRLLLAVLQAAL